MGESLKKRVLLVEDEPLVAMLLEDMLRDLGFDVVGPAMRLEIAVRLAEQEMLDAAILDVNLGGSRSYPVAELLVEKGVPFAFATGYGSAGVEWQDRVPVIRKPFQDKVISSVMDDLLAGRIRE